MRFKHTPSLFTAAAMFLLAAAGLWIVGLLWPSEIPGYTVEGESLLMNLCYYGLFAVLPVCIWASRHENAQWTLRLNPISIGDMAATIGIAILSLFLVQNLTTVWMALVQKLGLNVFVDDYQRPANVSELTLSVISAAIVAPIGEELLFRGVLQSAWTRKGPRQSILLTAVFFALLHGSVLGLPGELLGGATMALLVVWTDSLYAGLAFHSVYNAGSVVMNYLSSASAATAAEEALMQTNLLGYIGGVGGALLLVGESLLLLGLIGLLSIRMQLKQLIRMVARTTGRTDGKIHSVRELNAVLAINAEPDPRPMTTGTALVLLAGIVTCLGGYAIDVLGMLEG